MARAHKLLYLIDEEGRPLMGATVTVRDPGTATPISPTIYKFDTGDNTALANPFVAADSRVEFWLDAPKIVDLHVTKVGYDAQDLRAEVTQLVPSTLVFKVPSGTMTQRGSVKFMGAFSGNDNSGADQTEISLSYGGTGDIAAETFGATVVAGAVGKVADAGHKHVMPADPVIAHEAAVDPHPTYQTKAENDLLYDVVTAASGAITTHLAASDPHTQYTTNARATTIADTESDAAIVTHVAVDDPHTQYQKVSERNANSGYAGLNSSGTLDTNRRAFVGAQVAKSSDQGGIASGVPSSSAITFAAAGVVYDVGSIFNDTNDSFVIPAGADGYWTFHFHAEVGSSVTTLRVLIKKNGTGVTRVDSTGIDGDVVATLHAAAGDAFTFFLGHDKGSNNSCLGDGSTLKTFIECKYEGV